MQVAVDNSVQTKSLSFRLMILSAIMVATAVLVIAVGTLLAGTSIQVALIAFVACFVSALLAHVAGEYPKGELYIQARMALQIVARTLLPFVVAVWGLYFAEPPLEKSLVLYMILFYLVGLVADVQLSLGRIKAESESIN
jgi:uncharacterized membrane protein